MGGTLTDVERAALSEGRLLEHGTAVGSAFVVAALYSRFPDAPRPSTPAEPGAPGELR